MDGFDLDRATEVGWAGFLTRLAAHLATATEPLRITPYGAGSESAPALEVRPDGEVLHAELRIPEGRPALDEQNRRHLGSLGWREESPTAYLLERPRTHAHLLAAVVSDTLRHVVGAPHPAFLDAGSLTITPPDPADDVAVRPEIDLDEPVRVTTRPSCGRRSGRRCTPRWGTRRGGTPTVTCRSCSGRPSSTSARPTPSRW